MGHRHSRLVTEDVQLPPFCNLPYDVLKRILQYAYRSERSEALRYRLVNKTFNDVMLKIIRLCINYNSRKPHECQLRLTERSYEWSELNTIPTNSLIKSSLISNIFSVQMLLHSEGDVDQPELSRLLSGLCHTVEVSLIFLNSPPIQLAQQPGLLMVSVYIPRNTGKLTQAEVNLIANLQHLSRLSMIWRIVPRLYDQRVDHLQIWELQIDWRYLGISNLPVSFSDNFRYLRTLSITNIDILHTDCFIFRGVRLPHLIRCDIGLRCWISDLSDTSSTERLLTSMCSAMPKLTELNYKIVCWLAHLDENTLITSQFIRLCPATVKEFGFTDTFTLDLGWSRHNCGYRQTEVQWESHFTNLFTQVLDSNFNRVSIHSGLEPFWDEIPFQFKKCPSGEQIGMSEETTNINWLNGRHVPASRYTLKKRNGQMCKLYFNHPLV